MSTRYPEVEAQKRLSATMDRVYAWLRGLRDAGLTDLANELSSVFDVYARPARKVQDLQDYAAALHQEGSHGLAKEIEKVLAEPVMSTEQMKALAAEGAAYAGQDNYGGAVLLRSMADALVEAANRIEGDQK